MNFDQYKHSVAAEVRAAIARAGVTRHDVAVATGMAEATLSRKCNGQTAFNVVDVMLIAASLNIDPAALLPEVATAQGLLSAHGDAA